jgi:autotransporter passenger strand-loop-strand repeat protein
LAHGEQATYGGIAQNSTVDAGGILETALGGTFVSATINSGGTETLSSSSSGGTIHIGTDIDSIVETGGTQIVESGAQVLDDLVYGLQQIDTGATANSDLIDAGGTVLVQGVLIGDMAINGGLVELEPGASASSEMQFTGTGGTLELAPASVFTGTRIVGFDSGDTIVLQGVTGAIAFSTISDILTIGSTDIQLSGITAASSFVGTAVTIAGTAGTEITLEENAECLLTGTRIMTPQGAVAVENLNPGNEILTASGKTEKIEWIGRRSYPARFAAKNHLVRPIRIGAHAIAEGVPQRDLYVSPGHGIFIDAVLVPAWRLINGKTITQPELAQPEFDYYHIELATHAILLAENCPAETYLDIGARNQFQNAGSCRHRAPTPVTPLPRVENGKALEAIKAKLNARAGIEPRAENPANPVIGYVDHIGPNAVSGWALCPEDPETPVSLDIYFWRSGTLNRKTVLANIYRADLRNAGLGSGCHGFEAELPQGATRPRVLRSADGTPLSLTETAREMAA